MATRSVGEIRKSNGQAMEEAISHTNAPDQSRSNQLNELGQKIFLDRYALKDVTKRTLAVGDMVIVCVDDKTGQREIGTVRSMEGSRVTVELQDSTTLDRLIEHVSKPIETAPEQMMERVARGIAAVEGEQAEDWYHNFRWLLDGWKFVPAGRILTAAGTDQQLTFYNCFAWETPVHTREGVFPIGSLRGEHDVLSEGGMFRPAVFQSYGKQYLWEVTLENGSRLFATADHQWVVTKPKGGTERVLTTELEGNRIPVNPRPKPIRDSHFVAGLNHGIVFGDGSMQKKGSAHVELFGEKQQIAPLLTGNAYTVHATGRLPEHVRVTGFPREYKGLPDADAPPSYWYGFVMGLIATDGYVDSRGHVMFHNRSREVLERIAEGMLHTGFVPGRIIETRRFSPFDGEEKPCYKLTILKASVSPDDLLRELHRSHFVNSPEGHTATLKVISVKPTDRYEEVFCCVEMETHTITVGHGYLTGQCYVVPSPKDSRRGIVETLSQMMEIMSRGGGVGINVSSLRPRHSYVKGVNGRSSGSVSWGALYSFVTGLIEQGGCLTPDTMVFTEEGLLRLDEIVRHEEKGWRDHRLVVMTDEGRRASRHAFNNGIADVLTVSTDMGVELTGTPNHKVKVMTDRGQQWKELSELQSGDAIIIKLGQHAGKQQRLKKPDIKHHNQDAVRLPDVLDEELAFFLGYMAGDGFMTSREGDWRLGVAVSHNSYLIEEMPALIERLFSGAEVRTQQKENDASLTYIVSNRAVKEFLIINGLAKTRSAKASIPRLIRQSPPQVVAAFLRGLFEADGGLSHGYPMLTSSSKQLIDETATLLIGLGCPVKIEAQAAGEGHYGDKQIWRLRVHSFKGLEKWKAMVGCNARSRFAVCSNFDPELTREVSYRLPHPQHWIEPALSATALPQIDHRAMGQRIKSIDSKLRRKLLRYLRGDRHLTLSVYVSLAQSHEAFAEYAKPVDDTWFVYVKGVRKAGQSLTLDLEVDDNHTYIANGMVTHNSRRGALMLILNCWHPDVLEFINSKRDMGKITNANISVGITDKFMDAVHQDADWELVFPDTSDPDYETAWDGNLEKWIAAGKKVNVYNTVKARTVWNSIIESAWASAEPGVFFIERANKMSNSWYYDTGYLGCTNPCVTGDTLVSVEQGYVPARCLQEGMKIRTPAGLKPIEKVFNNGPQRIYRIEFSDGGYLKCTADHKLKVVREKKYVWVPTSDLKEGDKVLIAANESFGSRRSLPAEALEHIEKRGLNVGDYYDRNLGFAVGVVLGDGSFRKLDNRNSHAYQCSISFGAHEEAWFNHFVSLMERMNIHTHQTLVEKQIPRSDGTVVAHRAIRLECYKLATLLAKVGLEPNIKGPQKTLPTDFMAMEKEFLAGVLDGLFSTDGSVSMKQDNPMLRFHTSSYELAQQVRMLLLQFGIHGRIYRAEREEELVYDGRSMYGTGEKYDVILMNEGIPRFYSEIGLSHPEKAKRLKEVVENWHYIGGTWTASVVSIRQMEDFEEVYDVYEPSTLTWVTNGYVSFDCGEQPLPGFGVCNLGAINLSKFVREGDVAWDDLGQAVRYSVRFLDNVIDATPYFFDENFAQQKSERRVGLNTMGLAEMLIRLGIRYGSDESVDFIERLYLFIATESYRASAEIAAEKGPFPMFDADKFLQSGYMQTMPEEIRQMVREKGMRNVTLLTQAPNGCVAPDTLVFADGALRPIAALGDADGEQWQSISITTHSDTGAKSADKFYVNGLREVAEVTTGRGFRLAATLHHRVRIIDADGNYEWRQMGELQPGDTVVMARGGLGRAESPRLLPVPTENGRVNLKLPEAMTTELAELLGFYTGDGYLKDRRGLGIAVDARDEDAVGRLQEVIGRVFNLDARIEDTGRNCLIVWAGSYFIPRWMRANDLAKSNAFDARIPEAVLAGGARTTAAFLRGLFESDGSISNGVVTLVTASERLAREVQIALLGLGIVSTRRSIEPGEGRYGESLRHEVRLTGSAEVLCFRERVGFASKRKQALLDQCEDRGSRADSIPSALLRKLYAESEGLPTAVRQEIASAIRSGMTQQRWRDLASANPALGRLPSAHLLDGRLFFDSVASIALDHSFTFDLSVPDTNTYVANGVVAHNTIGTMVGTSTGIEPFYFWSYYRKSRLGQHEERVGVMEEWQNAHPKEELPSYFVTAMDLAPEEHVKVQAAIQRWVDSSISKTSNLPASYTVEQTAEIYELLYRLGCKGGTVYRDGSRDVQVLNLKEEDKRVSEKATEEKEVKADDSSEMVKSNGGLQPKVRPRPYKRRGYTVSKATPSGTAHITMNEDEEGQPFEVFVEIGKAGSDIKAMAEAMGRLMSLVLRMASPVSPIERVREIVKQITGIGGARSYGFGKRRVLSLPDAVGQALAENYMGVASGSEEAGQGAEMGVEIAQSKQKEIDMHSASADLCPTCGDSAFVRVEGCQTCYACGYSEC
ncbi:MAG: LAGLIDADG family homing endonuclease [Acidobacteriota bacterium]